MKGIRTSAKKGVQKIKDAFKTERTSASSIQQISSATNPNTENKTRKKSAVTSTANVIADEFFHRSSAVLSNTFHEQLTGGSNATPTAPTDDPGPPQQDTEIINNDQVNAHDGNADTAHDQLPAGSATVRTDRLDSQVAESSNPPNNHAAVLGQNATNYLETPVVTQAVAPGAVLVTASNTSPTDSAVPGQPPPIRPQLVQQSSCAAMWHKALNSLQEKYPDKYEALDKIIKNVGTPENNKVSGLFELSESKPESKALLLRAKAILPSLGTTRAVAMTIANVDPHKIAPYVVAGTFFIIDVLLGRLSLDDQRKIRNMLFESVNSINEWISFETNFLKRNETVEIQVQELEYLLPGLFSLALQLLCSLLMALDASWLDRIGDKLSAKMGKWQEQVEELKDHRAKWASRRKVMEEKLSGFDHVTGVLGKIRNLDDPEESLRSLDDEATSVGRYKDSASWILDSQTFKLWSQKFDSLEPSISTNSDTVSKPILWVSGSYGVGKTTVVHRIASELRRLAEGYLSSGGLQEDDSKAKNLQVITYFCNTTKRANHEIIIRSIAAKLSLLPNLTIAQATKDFDGEKISNPRHTMNLKDYEELVKSLLKERSQSCNIVLVIDALNQCDPLQDAETLCTFVHEIVDENPQIRVVFSSHEQLSGVKQLENHLEEIQVIAAAPPDNIKAFIHNELKFRQSKLEGSESIFCKPEFKSLSEELEQLLGDRAKGMYVWVRIWLDIMLPLGNSNHTVRLENTANKLFKELRDSSSSACEANKQLRDGYRRLWDLGFLRDFEEIRKRLFRFVICALTSLDLGTITDALRIGIEDSEPPYQKEISISFVEKLCSNFLQKNDSDQLSWTHDSARDFVVGEILSPGIDLAEPSAQNTLMKDNHRLVANTFLAVMGHSDHPVWKELDLDLSQCKQQDEDFLSSASLGVKLQQEQIVEKIRKAQSSLEYLGRYGWRHCQQAATKQVIFDPLWTRVLKELILHNKTAFPLWWEVSSFPYRSSGLGNSNAFIAKTAGKHIILSSHALASLDLGTDGISDALLKNLAQPSREQSAAENLVESLVEHSAYKSLDGANVLHVACFAGNNDVLKLMLNAISHRHGVARVFEFLEERYLSRTPFALALSTLRHADKIPYEYFGDRLLQTLLEFEKKHSTPDTHCLWSHEFNEFLNEGDDKTVLMWAMENAYPGSKMEDSLIALLRTHKPCNIDYQRKDQQTTALHSAASHGLSRLVKILVESCDATVDLPDNKGATPLDYARKFLGSQSKYNNTLNYVIGLTRVVDYLESIKQSD